MRIALLNLLRWMPSPAARTFRQMTTMATALSALGLWTPVIPEAHAALPPLAGPGEVPQAPKYLDQCGSFRAQSYPKYYTEAACNAFSGPIASDIAYAVASGYVSTPGCTDAVQPSQAVPSPWLATGVAGTLVPTNSGQSLACKDLSCSSGAPSRYLPGNGSPPARSPGQCGGIGTSRNLSWTNDVTETVSGGVHYRHYTPVLDCISLGTISAGFRINPGYRDADVATSFERVLVYSTDGGYAEVNFEDGTRTVVMQSRGRNVFDEGTLPNPPPAERPLVVFNLAAETATVTYEDNSRDTFSTPSTRTELLYENSWQVANSYFERTPLCDDNDPLTPPALPCAPGRRAELAQAKSGIRVFKPSTDKTPGRLLRHQDAFGAGYDIEYSADSVKAIDRLTADTITVKYGSFDVPLAPLDSRDRGLTTTLDYGWGYARYSTNNIYGLWGGVYTTQALDGVVDLGRCETKIYPYSNIPISWPVYNGGGGPSGGAWDLRLPYLKTEVVARPFSVMRPVNITDSSNRTIVLLRDAQGQLSGVTDSTGATSRFVYESESAEVLDIYNDRPPVGIKYTATYLKEVHDPLGNTISLGNRATGLTRVNPARIGSARLSYPVTGGDVDVVLKSGVVDGLSYGESTVQWGISEVPSVAWGASFDVRGGIVARSGQAYSALFDGARMHVTADLNPRNGWERVAGDVDHSLAYESLDSDGRLVERQDVSGSGVKLTYAPNSSVILSELRVGPIGDSYQTTFADHEPVCQQPRTIVAGSLITTRTFGPKCETLSETSPDGVVTNYAYDTTGLLTSVSVAGVQQASYAYNALREVSRIDYAGGLFETFTYDNRHFVTSHTDTSGATTSSTITRADGQPDKVCLNGTACTSFKYDAMGHLVEETSPTGFVTNYTYAPSLYAGGYVMRSAVTQPHPPELTSEIRMTFNKFGEPEKRTEAGSKITTFATTYYSNAILQSSKAFGHSGSGSVLSDLAGNPLEERNELGQLTVHTYDGLKRPLATTRGSLRSAVSRDANGQVVESYANSLIQKFERGPGKTWVKKTTTTDRVAGSTTTEVVRDAFGRVTESRDLTVNGSLAVTTQTYDTLGRPLETRMAPQGGNYLIGQNIYTSGVPGVTSACAPDPSSAGLTCTPYTYGPWGILTAREPNGSSNMTYTYDAFGRLATVQGLNKNLTYTYDGLSRVTKVSEGAASETTVYNGDGTVASVTDQDGNARTFAYDEAFRVAKISYTPGAGFSPTPDDTFTYFDDGTLKTATNAASTESFEYDASRGDLVASTQNGRRVRYDRTDFGAVRNIDYFGMGGVSYALGDGKQVNSMTLWGGQKLDFIHDDAGRLTRTMRPNGVQTAYTYGPQGWVMANANYKLGTSGPGGTAQDIFTQRISRFLDGRISSIADTKGASSFKYSAQGRLTEATMPLAGKQTFGYDVGGNLTGVNGIPTAEYGANDRIQNTLGYASSPSGALLTAPSALTAEGWDCQNTLIGANGRVTGTWTGTSGYAAGQSGQGQACKVGPGRVTVADAGVLDATTSLTLDITVKLDTLPTANRMVVGKWGSGSADQAYKIDYIAASKKFQGVVRIGTTNHTVTSSTVAVAGTWYRLQLSYDGTTVRLFVDGAQQATKAATGSINSGAAVLAVGGASATTTFAGAFDNLSVSSVAQPAPAGSCTAQAVTTTCAGKACGPAVNNCGTIIQCPDTCTGNTTCGGGTSGDPNVCGVSGCASNVATLCAGKECGTVVDSCGRTLDCGICGGVQNTCAAGVRGDGSSAGAGQCGCIEVGNACSGKQCGTAVTNCGRTIQCANTCQEGTACGTGGAGPNACGCVPDNVAACLGKACGPVTNNCLQQVTCPSTCAAGTACGAQGAAPTACGNLPPIAGTFAQGTSWGSSATGGVVDLDWCINRCRTEIPSRYAMLANGNSCACANDLPPAATRVSNAAANVACANKASQMCGGSPFVWQAFDLAGPLPDAGAPDAACVAEPISATCSSSACGTRTNNCGTAVSCPNTCTGAMACGVSGASPNQCGCSATNTSGCGVGCFAQGTFWGSGYQASWVTPATCAADCRAQGSKYSAVAGGGWCTCADELPSASTLVSDTMCNTACPGNALETCGGPNFTWRFYNPYVATSVDPGVDAAIADSGLDARPDSSSDASVDARSDASTDASTDARADASADASTDARSDASEAGADAGGAAGICAGSNGSDTTMPTSTETYTNILSGSLGGFESGSGIVLDRASKTSWFAWSNDGNGVANSNVTTIQPDRPYMGVECLLAGTCQTGPNNRAFGGVYGAFLHHGEYWPSSWGTGLMRRLDGPGTPSAAGELGGFADGTVLEVSMRMRNDEGGSPGVSAAFNTASAPDLMGWPPLEGNVGTSWAQFAGRTAKDAAFANKDVRLEIMNWGWTQTVRIDDVRVRTVSGGTPTNPLNGNFESELSFWKRWTNASAGSDAWVTSGTQAFAGTRGVALKHGVDGAGSGIQQELPVPGSTQLYTSGDRVELSAWVRTPAGTANVSVEIAYGDYRGVVTGVASAGCWTQVKGVVTVAQRWAGCDAGCYTGMWNKVSNTTPNATVFVDNVRVNRL